MAQKSLSTNDRDLLNFLVSFWPEFNVTVSNINMPTSDFVVQFCERFLMEFCLDLHNMAPSSEDFADVMYLKVIQQSMETIFEYFFVHFKQLNFELEDLLNPNSKRTKAIIRVSMNILAFKNNVLQSIYALELDVEQKIAKFQEIEEELEKCSEKVERLGSQLAECLKTKAQSIEEKDNLYRLIKELADEDMLHENQQLVKVYTDLEAEQEQVTEKLNVLAMENAELDKLVVADANDIKSEYETIKKNLSELEEDNNHWNIEVKSKNKSLYLEMLEQMEKVRYDAKEFSDNLGHIDELKLTEETLTKELQEREVKQQKLRSDLEEARDSVSVSDQLQFMKADWEVRRAALYRELEHLTEGQQHQTESVSLAKLDQKIQSVIEEEKQLEEEKKQFDEQCQETYNKILNSKSDLYNTMFNYLQRVEEEVDKLNLNFQWDVQS